MVETHLRWFGQVERRPLDCVVRKVDQMESTSRQNTRGRGRLEKLLEKLLRKF